MLLWLSRNARWDALRWAAVGVMPAVGLTLYFTYSRGGVVALALGALCLVALSRDRLWMLATLAIAALGALPALLAVPGYRSLADNVASQTSVDQGVSVLLILLAGTAGSLVLFALLRRLERGDGPRTRRAVELSRDPACSRSRRRLGVAAVIAAIAFGGRAWDQFSSTDLEFPTDPAQHFSDFSSAGRHDFWRVALDAFDEEPLIGHGAGTYEFSWEELRSIELNVIDAHSLYLEFFAELGLAGGLLLLALVGGLLWAGLAAWRAGPSPEREAYAALLAAMLVFAVGAGFDWFWEIAALGAIFCLAAGAVVGGALRTDLAARGGPRGWALRRRRRRRRTRLARGDRPDRPTPGRAGDQRQQGRGRRRQRQQRRRPRRDRPLDRALGRLPLPAARPDRGAPQRIRPRRGSADAGDRTRGRQLGALRAALQGRGRGRRRGRRPGRPRKGP